MFEPEMRGLAIIQRWTIVRTHRNQSVAEHSYNVAMYANDIMSCLPNLAPNFCHSVLQMALWHDMDEIFTGDMPGPAKRALTHKKSAYKEIVGGWMDRIFGIRQHRDGSGMSETQTNTAKAILKVADELDAACEMAVECGMGNKHARPHIERRIKSMEGHLSLLVDYIGLDEQRATKLKEMLTAAVYKCIEPSRAPLVFGEVSE